MALNGEGTAKRRLELNGQGKAQSRDVRNCDGLELYRIDQLKERRKTNGRKLQRNN